MFGLRGDDEHTDEQRLSRRFGLRRFNAAFVTHDELEVVVTLLTDDTGIGVKQYRLAFLYFFLIAIQ
ncbi:hypothetical protein [Haladaptatus sp. DFWS20]|uniref:hypothetical protein n=1 Tax=Haladaptatus sp. DFWS20 TaxID=3403467 RepID=UPI003EB9CD2B